MAKLGVGLIALYFGLLLAGLVGWVMNIYKLCTMGFDHLSGLLVARGIGIVIAPLGAILGYF